MVYAGSGQYLAVNFFAPGVSFVQVIFLTLMVNIRHVFYGISLLEKFNNMGKKRWYMIFGLTDESFSVNCVTDAPEGVDRSWFAFFITLLNHCYWVAGASMGGMFGSVLQFNTQGLDFVMTAMFVVIFLEQWKKENNHLCSVLGLVLPVGCLMLFGADSFMIPAMIAIFFGLAAVRKSLEGKVEA